MASTLVAVARPRLVYLPFRAMAETSRMMLAHGGIEYDDEAIWGVEFQRRKVSGEFPWDRLPMTVRVKNKARRDELNNSTFLVVPLLLIIVALLSVILPLLPSANAAYTLEHKRTLVTGASGGIGAGIAKTLAQKGARVLVHYNTRRDGAEATAQSIRDSGGMTTKSSCIGTNRQWRGVFMGRIQQKW